MKKWNSALSWKRILLDGSILNGTVGGLFLSSYLINIEMWVEDYPPDIKEAFGPQSKKAQTQGAIVAILSMGILLIGVILSNRKLRQDNGGTLTFKEAFSNGYALLLFFWLFDLTIIDWLFFVTLTPQFMVLPGTEGMAGYSDYGFHLTTSLSALLFMAIPALIVAFFMSSRPNR